MRQANASESSLVCAGRNRPDGPDNTNPAGPGNRQQRAQARVDHPYEGDVELVAQMLESGRGRIVARDDHQFDVVVLDKLVRYLRCEKPHLLQAPRPVGVAAGVPHVDEVLGREQVDQRPGDRQAPKTAIEHPYGPVVHPR